MWYPQNINLPVTGNDAPTFLSFSQRDVVVPAAGLVLATIASLPVDGRFVHIELQASGIDAADDTAVTTSQSWFTFRRSGGSVAVVTGFPGLSTTVGTGPANTFGQDVALTLSGSVPDDIVFLALNTAGADRTGDITANFKLQFGGTEP